MLRHARQFRDADIVVIAAPYYDLSFPSALKNYLEAICCVGLTFYYDENEIAQTHKAALGALGYEDVVFLFQKADAEGGEFLLHRLSA